MVCSFCGNENPVDNRFCGMCGVRLERRFADRRVSHDAAQLKCPSCSHVNEAGYKFCGQCGARVDRRVNERRGNVTEEARAMAGANASLPTPDDSRWRKAPSTTVSSDRESDVLSPPANPSANIFVNDARREDLRREDIRREDLRREDLRRNEVVRNELTREALRRPGSRSEDLPRDASPPLHGDEHRSVIMGPSFLGLGNESESEGEYLLEDESGSGAGIRRLILLAVLIAIVGLIFLQWRSSLKANQKAPEPAPGAAPRGKLTAPALPGQNQPGQSQNQSADSPASDPGAVPTASHKVGPIDNTPNVMTDASSASKNQGDALTGPDDPSLPANQADRNPAEGNTGDAAKLSNPGKANDLANTNERGKASDTSKPEEDAREGETANTAGVAKADPAKTAVVDPSAINPAAPVRPSATLVRAQQFLQGRGVQQNCEQGLVYLRAAAQKNEPAAAVQMGALYSAGHCVKQDRVMAYRWFNSAHELQPANQWIQKSMDQLWAQMNEQERRLSGY
jgi:hypothetical protein